MFTTIILEKVTKREEANDQMRLPMSLLYQAPSSMVYGSCGIEEPLPLKQVGPREGDNDDGPTPKLQPTARQYPKSGMTKIKEEPKL